MKFDRRIRLSYCSRHQQIGLSLVELAIVLVLLALMIGGILRAQELVTSARVRNIIDQVRAVQVAYYGFQDRYHALPGDLTPVQAALVNPNAAPALNGYGDGWVPIEDSEQFFNNIAQAGFFNCSQCMEKQTQVTAGVGGNNPDAAHSPTNLFGQPIGFAYPSAVPNTNAVGTLYLSTQLNEGTKAMATTGGQIESKALAEVDRKMDDGNPATGQFRMSGSIPSINGVITTPALTHCVVADAALTFTWRVNPPGQCQGVLLL